MRKGLRGRGKDRRLLAAPDRVSFGLAPPAPPASFRASSRVPLTVPLILRREFRVLVLAGTFLGAALLVFWVDVLPKLRRAKQPAEALAAVSLDGGSPDGGSPAPGAGGDLDSGDAASRGLLPFDGALEGLSDGGLPEASGEAYLRVLGYVGRAPGALVGDVPRGGAPRAADSRALLGGPERFRGEVLRVTALFLRSDPVRLPRPVDGREWVHRTYLVDRSGEWAWVVDLLERPSAEPHRLCRVDGVFLRLAGYEAVRGKALVPFFLARGLTALEEKR